MGSTVAEHTHCTDAHTKKGRALLSKSDTWSESKEHAVGAEGASDDQMGKENDEVGESAATQELLTEKLPESTPSPHISAGDVPSAVQQKAVAACKKVEDAKKPQSKGIIVTMNLLELEQYPKMRLPSAMLISSLRKFLQVRFCASSHCM